MKPNLTSREHYDRLAESGNGLNDPPFAREYMARWDGPLFWKAIGDLREKDVLEAGVGCGRITGQLLKNGCGSLTGLDISPRTIQVARDQLKSFRNLKLILTSISEFCQPAGFDVFCSVLTFMHVMDKQKALQNAVNSLRPGGRIVLSIDNPSDTFDFGEWTVTLYPWAPERYAETLTSLGCDDVRLTPLIDSWTGPDGQKLETFGKPIATLIEATWQ